MKISRNILYAIIGLGLYSAAGCSNDPYLYKAPVDAIWLSGDASQNATSQYVEYSFKSDGNDGDYYILNLVVNVVGNASDKDRRFNIDIVEEETNVSSSCFELGETVVPAGAISVKIPVKVKHYISDVDLTKEFAKLTFCVKSTEDLAAGIVERNKYTLKWCDYFLKPSSWSRTIDYYIGPFTQARYKFIMDFTGVTTFHDDDYNWVLGFQSQLTNLLNKYNEDPANADRPEGWPYKNDDGSPLAFGPNLKK